MDSIVLEAHKQNLSFKAELLKKNPQHYQSFTQIIEAVESTPINIDKRITSIRFNTKTEAVIRTGFCTGPFHGTGRILKAIKKNDKWTIIPNGRYRNDQYIKESVIQH